MTASLLLVHGDDTHRVDEEVRLWRAAAIAAQLGVEVIEAPAPLDRVRSALAEVPLIDERRFVLLRDPPQLGGGQRAGGAARELAAALQLTAPSTSVCLVSHRALPASHPVLEAVGRLGGEVRQRSPLRGRELRVWADSAARERGVRLAPGGIEHLLRVAGTDLGIIASELDKLAAFSTEGGDPPPAVASTTPAPGGGPRGGALVDLDSVRRLVGGAEGIEVWGVLERLLGPAPSAGAVAALDLVDEGRSTVYLIATLAGQLSELRQAQALMASGERPPGIARRLRIPEWRAERLARQAQSVSPATVEGWLRRFAALDVAIKTGVADDRVGMAVFALGAAREVRAQGALRSPSRSS